jgi:hypothetical protein
LRLPLPAAPRCDCGFQTEGHLNARWVWRPLFVNLSLTLSSVFLILKDLRRNRLANRLTRLKPAPTLDKYGKNTERDALAAVCAAALPAPLGR